MIDYRFVLVFLIIISPLSAKQIHAYDMASLAFQSDYIISTRTPPPPKIPGNYDPNPTEIIIDKVFKGDLKAGDKIPLDYYYEFPRTTWNSREDVGSFRLAILFLIKNDEKHWAELPAAQRNHFVQISSGLRLITSKNIWRVQQYGNPGPLVLTPYQTEFIRLHMFDFQLYDKPFNPPAEIPEDVKISILEQDVVAAIDRANIFKKAERENNYEILKLFIYPSSWYPGLENFLCNRAVANFEARKCGKYLDITKKDRIQFLTTPPVKSDPSK